MASYFAAVLLLTSAVSGFHIPALIDEPPNYRLPEEIQPSNYVIELSTRIDKFNDSDESSFSYDGKVTIESFVSSVVSSVVLHSYDTISIKTASINSPSQGTLETGVSYDAVTNKLTLKSENNDVIGPGAISIIIEFSGKHGTDPIGFYRSSYNDDSNTRRYLISTQFEPDGARRAFPCFDEPSFKATYEIAITISKGVYDDNYFVISNVPNPEITNGTDTVTYKFPKSSQKMSPYLVAFAVTDFSATETSYFTSTNKSFTTYGRKRWIDNGEGSLSQITGPAVLELMSDLAEYPLPKIDQIGLPITFFGGMENWGFVIYREQSLFFNEERDSTEIKQKTVAIIAHELSHQWFGDLVTMHWWSDVWLNEGFATFFQYHVTDQIRTPDLNTSSWEMIGQMVTDQLQGLAFEVDGYENAPAVSTEINSAGNASFGDIPYAKGGSIIRMWMHSLGRDEFYTGLKKYLLLRGNSVSTPEILMKDIDGTLPSDHKLKGKVLPTFRKWYEDSGYPVITVSRNETNVTVSQERFYWSNKVSDSDSNWVIPLTYATNEDMNFESTAPIDYLDSQNKTIAVNNFTWIILNVQQTGYYRVNYDMENWNEILNVLQTDHTIIPAINRAQIINDVFSLARSSKSYTTYDLALNMSLYLSQERDLVPWRAAFAALNFLNIQLTNTPASEKLQALLVKILEDPYAALTLNVKDTDSHTTRILRTLITSWACKIGLETCIEDATGLFSEMTSTAATLPNPDVRSAVACIGVRNGNKEEWDRVWNMYLENLHNIAQNTYLTALGCSSNVDNINNLLSQSIDSQNEISGQRTSSIFTAVLDGNLQNINIVLKFLENNIEGMSHIGVLDSIIDIVSRRLNTKEHLDFMNNLSSVIDSSSDPIISKYGTAARKAVETIGINNEWLSSKEESITNWLVENISDSPTDSNPDSAVISSVNSFILSFVIFSVLINN